MSWFNIIKKLSGNQHRIDANKDGKITAEDFRQLREESDDTEKLAPLAAAGAIMASKDKEKMDVVTMGKTLSNKYKKEGKRLSNKFKQ